MVQALVSAHSYPSNARDQPLQKGKGLVALLHGTPGSGKTLTAESVAEMTKKALFSCSMSELNKYNDPWSFEWNLKKFLRLATTWRAVVLFDEADVFLEARQDGSNANAERNALVAIFLRHLEYFSGIIFLTTNRVRVFDGAMTSRIHLALRFSPPARDARRQLWKNQLTRLPDSPSGTELDTLLHELQEHNLNGREIANSVLTAATLARYRERPLEAKHIRPVLKMRQDFRQNLNMIRKHEDDKSRDSYPPLEATSGVARAPSWLTRRGTMISEEPEEME